MSMVRKNMQFEEKIANLENDGQFLATFLKSLKNSGIFKYFNF